MISNVLCNRFTYLSELPSTAPHTMGEVEHVESFRAQDCAQFGRVTRPVLIRLLHLKLEVEGFYLQTFDKVVGRSVEDLLRLEEVLFIQK